MTERNIWFISDTHLFHKRILTFTDDKGNLIRPGFSSVEEMNEKIVENWNSVIRDQDKVYHLGDVTFYNGSKFNELFYRLKGHKRLLPGNHDDIPQLIPHFQKVQLWRIFKEHGFIATHVPIHHNQFRHKMVANLHGHIHANEMEEAHYINACVEHWNYMPIHVDQIRQIIKDRGLKLPA